MYFQVAFNMFLHKYTHRYNAQIIQTSPDKNTNDIYTVRNLKKYKNTKIHPLSTIYFTYVVHFTSLFDHLN